MDVEEPIHVHTPRKMTQSSLALDPWSGHMVCTKQGQRLPIPTWAAHREGLGFQIWAEDGLNLLLKHSTTINAFKVSLTFLKPS